MYDKRIKIFIILSAALLLLCLLRLTQMQLLSHSFYRDRIAKLKLQKGLSLQLKTVRGKILDRKGRILATDEPKFQLYINYGLTSFMDDRLKRAKLLRTTGQHNANPALANMQKEWEDGLKDLQQIIDKCTYFGLERTHIEDKIKKINDKIWNLRTFVAWVRNGPDPDILEKYNHKVNSIPLSEAIANFEKKEPNEDHRLLLVSKVDDIVDIDKSWPLVELKTDDDIFAAQLEFLDVDGVHILPKPQRFYPFGSAAAQTIGWVGPAQEADRQLFADDRLSSYLHDEVCGREDGTEYICEPILRGKRGEVLYDIDRQLISRTETRFGKDVQLSLDVELQQRVEEYLANCQLNPNCKAPTAAVIIEVATGDILVLASIPVFDLNRIRYDYTALAGDPNEPLRNRAINKQYPPGSAVKPLILIAGLESGKITTHEIISCQAQQAPKGWPSCWLYNRYRWMGHDDQWQNNARNAIKGSCNIYFSHLADRIDPSVLQQWLFKFGYGQRICLAPCVIRDASNATSDAQGLPNAIRDLRQAQGQISSSIPESAISDFNEVPPLKRRERRFFGIGQGNLRVTPLQVANAFAVIARGGLYKVPRLFLPSATAGAAKQSQINMEKNNDFEPASIALNISPQTLAIVYDGMSAVVNEPDGTAYKEFAPAGFAEQDIKVYGKTGSTEEPDNAWFAGFAEDSISRSIAIALVVEGGQHGSSDAAPLARDIIQFCIEAGYIGNTSNITERE